MKCSYLGCDNDIRRNDLCDGHSQQYGISKSTVLRIKRGEIWKSVSR